MNTTVNIPCVLSIAGSDSSGGAGIQADIKAISATGSYAASVITALTAQNTLGVHAIHPIPSSFVTEQIDAVCSDLDICAIKIGMLHTGEMIDAVAACLETYRPPYVVYDPVMIAKNGCSLIDNNVIDLLKERLFKLCTILTPNIPEGEHLLNRNIASTTEMESAARDLGKQYRMNILVKGGHLDTEQAADVLYLYQEDHAHWLYADRIKTNNTHGTGCTLSSAIASYLAQGYDLLTAVTKAKHYLTQAIASGSYQKIGHGHGPVDHFFFE